MKFDDNAGCHSDDIFVSTDKRLLDHRWLVANLLAQSWATCWTHERLHEAIANSLTFGVYHHVASATPGDSPHDRMIGFARVITDGVTYSMLTDVVLDGEFRRRGIGSFLISNVVTHPSVAGTVSILRTNSPAAESLYAKFGYAQVTAMRRIPV